MKANLILAVIISVLINVSFNYCMGNYKISDKEIGEIAHEHMNILREHDAKNEKAFRICIEAGYWDGQKDALKGRIAIDTINQKWIKSCYNNDTVIPFRMIYNPQLNITDNAKIINN